MARDIDYTKPDTWDDDDVAYLRERADRLPESVTRHLGEPDVPTAPAPVAQSPATAQLSDLIRRHWPERADDDPIGVAVDLLSELAGDDGSAEEEGDDYDEWKVAELAKEMDTRGVSLPDGAPKTKASYIAALREHDASR